MDRVKRDGFWQPAVNGCEAFSDALHIGAPARRLGYEAIEEPAAGLKRKKANEATDPPPQEQA